MITVSLNNARLIAAANAAWQATENKPATVTERVAWQQGGTWTIDS